jgi:hypothetical protein
MMGVGFENLVNSQTEVCFLGETILKSELLVFKK